MCNYRVFNALLRSRKVTKNDQQLCLNGKPNAELDVKHESQYASVIADRAKLECFTRLLTSFVLVKSMSNAHKQHNYYGHNDATTFQNLTYE